MQSELSAEMHFPGRENNRKGKHSIHHPTGALPALRAVRGKLSGSGNYKKR